MSKGGMWKNTEGSPQRVEAGRVQFTPSNGLDNMDYTTVRNLWGKCNHNENQSKEIKYEYNWNSSPWHFNNFLLNISMIYAWDFNWCSKLSINVINNNVLWHMFILTQRNVLYLFNLALVKSYFLLFVSSITFQWHKEYAFTCGFIVVKMLLFWIEGFSPQTVGEE